MPLPLAPIAIAGAASAGVLALAFSAKKNNDKAAIAAQCDDVRTRLEAASRAGQDPHEQELLRIEYSACLRRAVANGVNVDPALYLLPCNLVRDYLTEVWRDYKSTSYSDPVARDNKRNAILSQGAQMIACLRGQMDSSTTIPQVRVIVDAAAAAAADSLERANCMRVGSPGCGRFAVNEESGDERGWKDLEAIGIPAGLSEADVSVFFHNHPEREAAFYRAANLTPPPPPAGHWTTTRAGSAGGSGGRRVFIYDDPDYVPPSADARIYGGLRARGEAKIATLRPQLDLSKIQGALVRAGGFNQLRGVMLPTGT